MGLATTMLIPTMPTAAVLTLTVLTPTKHISSMLIPTMLTPTPSCCSLLCLRLQLDKAKCGHIKDVAVGPGGAMFFACDEPTDEYVFTESGSRSLKLRDRAFFHYQ